MKIQMKASLAVTRRDVVGDCDESAMCGRNMVDMTVTRQTRRPNGAVSRNLNIRVPSEVLDAAKARAAEREETLSAAVVAFLREYAEGGH